MGSADCRQLYGLGQPPPAVTACGKRPTDTTDAAGSRGEPAASGSLASGVVGRSADVAAAEAAEPGQDEYHRHGQQ